MESRLRLCLIAAALGLSRATAYREWTFARAWLAAALADNSEKK